MKVIRRVLAAVALAIAVCIGGFSAQPAEAHYYTNEPVCLGVSGIIHNAHCVTGNHCHSHGGGTLYCSYGVYDPYHN